MHIKLTLLILILVLVGCGKQEPQTASGRFDNGLNQPTRTPRPTIEPPLYETALISEGQADYNVYCVACHGREAGGVQGLGVNLRVSEFVDTRTDEELLAFVLVGRPSDHPDNTTNVTMPPRGGFPNLQDGQILNIIAYVRSLN
jgi:mono/diheme cytochrome c family protein